ncbi:MAG: hypothetical protein ABIJ09_04685 [Pseudomonadota bacterium]
MDKELLVSDDPDKIRAAIDQLKTEHAELKRRVDHLHDRPYLSPDEQLEAKTLQRMKLLKKDAIAVLEAKL